MKQVTLIGIGMGNTDTLTLEGKRSIEEAEVLIGAKRMVESAYSSGKACFITKNNEQTLQYIKETSYHKYAILLSGDTGFYSGTNRLLPLLLEYEVKVLPGISSVSYFAAKLGMSWENAYILSLHGRKGNVTAAVREHEKTFLLTDGNLDKICLELTQAGLGEATIYIGECLSYPEEKLTKAQVKDLTHQSFASISVAFIINFSYQKEVRIGIPEEEFIRGQVPMTKSEIRAISISKLQIAKDSVVYDIGAGTGSVSVEMALLATKGKVYAVEQKEEAVDLIHQNKEKFGLTNLTVIHGLAPEVMEELEVPDMAFIGGSSGNLREIVKCLIEKNSSIRLVINAIALETLTEAVQVCTAFKLDQVEIVQASIAKARELGSYHLLMGQNPVFIISGRGAGPCSKEK
ncbi:bifunctional cobalt-precorrin-7 (C(5))-methyltransferase/cobalt-precorrin-6B (C(15))-methyltransferase [Anaerocolumna cellulosilytica]|uniref:Bifunctional cobalt-precorrin-7 (C(5))-methyltransferase/cobalt-precorrin-6B (C(15))-methyltransferase n=1 Tax=Anaerocolumna cellulosilytica TaxID=433286 RepID=A0A6S6R2M8_9FIRM|nr:precorrin-6y C5,15-methyltransferase (decarboxylating) subunit CbiE [Anaerocolumna cellulosilytica]MBB5196368.1 precorrin-6Y C5,15-methyltransferase (decarboxylating) [Anaerocolumna cellulosilytica]BCJ96396.1 bifunctional cobalt-precorrin-7 (C(5))-methyltransferase/cobalt-precorrin-6B (C(15))-methyltransferase [Anaerocolumna cellulosilytica]